MNLILAGIAIEFPREPSKDSAVKAAAKLRYLIVVLGRYGCTVGKAVPFSILVFVEIRTTFAGG